LYLFLVVAGCSSKVRETTSDEIQNTYTLSVVVVDVVMCVGQTRDAHTQDSFLSLDLWHLTCVLCCHTTNTPP
jgi:hypothetical protein